ncbi:MAG: pyruvate kinase [Hyphomicrobiales bacterium]|nr:pyruvate kinase [Hyphomicrobiales bacterium]MCC7481110.1 pyruvate kinase [Hyphomicrobiales bacterium]
MRRNRKVKILATLGPASSSPEMIEKLFVAGVDVFRINMSHTSHALLAELHRHIRNVESKLNRPIGILADLQGPKIRIGTFKDKEVQIKAGDKFAFDTDATPGDSKRVHLPHPEIFASVKVGDFLLLNDGRLRVEIAGVSPDRIETVIIFGGTLSNRKGVNLPNTLLPIAALTEKDRADLEAAASIGVDWIALSFVQRPEDVSEARELIAGRAGVMAKIEKPSALLCLDDILKVSDGIMVARGDLGVELPLETVPARQKQLTRAARRAGKPVVVATQMLESMIVEPVPTRAEVSDVATAVYEGADAIMLSAESAAGAWPEKAVATMDKIALSAEGDSFYRGIMNAQRNDPQPTTADAISTAARSISETLDVAAIVSYTESGSTAMRVARERPNVPIITLTPIPATARRLALAWGQHCVLTPNANDLEHMIETACQFASSEGFAEEGQRIIITVGVPLGSPGSTNMLRIAQVGKKKTPAA